MPSESKKDPENRIPHTKKKQVLEQIRREILGRERKPGSIISAKGLAKELGISRTPVREAMESLASEGLIEWVGVSGAMVRNVSEDQLYNILRFRAALDTEVGQTLACHYDERAIHKLRSFLGDMKLLAKEAEVDPKRRDEFYELDMQFHKLMIRLAQADETVEPLMDRLMDHLRLFAAARVSPVADIIEEHEKILDAIDAGKGGKYTIEVADGVQEAVRDHMRGTANRWSKSLFDRLKEQWPRRERKQESTPHAGRTKSPSKKKA
jgi:DNA-binding GntR family transcriptional regulator